MPLRVLCSRLAVQTVFPRADYGDQETVAAALRAEMVQNGSTGTEFYKALIECAGKQPTSNAQQAQESQDRLIAQLLSEENRRVTRNAIRHQACPAADGTPGAAAANGAPEQAKLPTIDPSPASVRVHRPALRPFAAQVPLFVSYKSHVVNVSRDIQAWRTFGWHLERAAVAAAVVTDGWLGLRQVVLTC